MACSLLTVPIYRHYNKYIFGRRLTCANGMLPAERTHLPIDTALISRRLLPCSQGLRLAHGTNLRTLQMRFCSLAYLLTWPAATSRYPSSDTTRNPSSLAGFHIMSWSGTTYDGARQHMQLCSATTLCHPVYVRHMQLCACHPVTQW